MSRDALPPVPPVQGTPATYTVETFARTWEPRRETWVERAHPEPVQRAIEVEAGAACVPPNAAKFARAGAAYGFGVRITHAIGYAFDQKTGGIKMRAVMELTGEMTAGTAKSPPRPAKKKVGEIPSDPVDSLRVVVRTPTLLLAGHWVDRNWEFGLVLSGHTLVQNCDWGQLWEALKNAEGEADVRGEDQRQQVLPGLG